MVCRALVGGLLSVVSAGCWGLSLGQFAGLATMGRGLDIHIPLGLSAGESAADLCPVVKVYFAEDVLPSGLVKVAVRMDGANGSAALHVSTLSVLTEPYARIDVIAGCKNQFSRQYTILADLPSLEGALPTKVFPAVSLPVGQQLPATPVAVQRNAGAPLVDGGRLGTGQSDSVKPTRAAKPASTSAPRTIQRGTPNRVDDPVAQGSRLKLDPIELVASLAQLAPSLRLESDSFSAVDVAANPELEQRRVAARSLWKAMNEAPEQAVTNAAKVDTSGAEGQRLRAQLTAARQAEAELQVTLDAEREGVYTHPVVLALGGALLLALGGLALLWRRKHVEDDEKQPWWKRQAGNSNATDMPAKAKKGPSTLKAAVRKLMPVRTVPVDIDVDTLFPPDSGLDNRPSRQDPSDRKSAQGPTTIGGQDFLASTLMDGARSVATEELFDLQQQVEFFISLGQAEQAVDVLVNHLSDSHEPSPLAYLDLLRLYHDLDRRSDYEALRKDFNRLFSGAAPAFDDYSHSRRGLERYESALSRIQNLWNKPAVLDVIERSIFRQSSTQDHDVFDLEAYRELLLLCGIAREVLAPEGAMDSSNSSAVPSAFGALRGELPARAPGSTVLQPLVAQTRESRARANAVPMRSSLVDVAGDDRTATPAVTQANSSGVDIDLSLDFDLPGDNLDMPDLPAKSPATVPSIENADPMSFDLSDSLFDALPEPGAINQISNPSYADKSTPALQIDEGASLDFSGLDDIDAFTIKKSGLKS